MLMWVVMVTIDSIDQVLDAKHSLHIWTISLYFFQGFSYKTFFWIKHDYHTWLFICNQLTFICINNQKYHPKPNCITFCHRYFHVLKIPTDRIFWMGWMESNTGDHPVSLTNYFVIPLYHNVRNLSTNPHSNHKLDQWFPTMEPS